MHRIHVTGHATAMDFAEARPAKTRSLAWRAFWRSLPWTAGAVTVYAFQLATSIFMGGEWNTALVTMQAIVVAAFVAIFYALAVAKEREKEGPA